MKSQQILSILIIDDNRGDFVLAKELLKEIKGSHYDVQWAPSYKAALEAIKTQNFDLYLVDQYLDNTHTGLQLIGDMQNLGVSAPFILLTGQADDELDKNALESGAVNFLVKGKIDSGNLERSIRYAIRQKKQEERKLIQANFYDKTTGLANLFLFKEHLKQSIAFSQRYKKNIAILLFDIDDFSRINQSLSRSGGDQLLKLIAKRLLKSIRRSDIAALREEDSHSHVARIGNDEFTILLNEIDLNSVHKIAQRILKVLTAPCNILEHEIFITTSLGISIFPNDGENAEQLLLRAETALAEAQKIGKNNYQFYRPSMNQNALLKLKLENSLHRALEKEELELYYQPQIDLKTGAFIGAEALLRWNHPELGIVSPNDFIPLAEETGLIAPIGEWVFLRAFRQFNKWRSLGIKPMKISINLSQQQFLQPNLLKMLANKLKDENIPPHSIEIEITESIAMNNENNTITMLGQLKNLDIKLSIDDFGTGYSSFSYLQHFPLDSLKIDQSFIRELSQKSNTAIVKAIIAMAHSLDLEVIAEGVENFDQLKILHDLQCDYAQGYYFSKPIPENEINQFIREIENYKEIIVTEHIPKELRQSLNWLNP